MENRNFLMGKLSISMAFFNSHVQLPKGKEICLCHPAISDEICNQIFGCAPGQQSQSWESQSIVHAFHGAIENFQAWLFIMENPIHLNQWTCIEGPPAIGHLFLCMCFNISWTCVILDWQREPIRPRPAFLRTATPGLWERPPSIPSNIPIIPWIQTWKIP